MTEPIIVGTDGSAPADRAVRWAADEAARRDRPLHIVHTEERWPYDIPLYPVPGERISLTEMGRGVLVAAEKLAREQRPDLHVTTELVAQPTVTALCERSTEAFEIVLGHRGLGGFTAMLLGSVGLRTAEHSSAPVVIVRGEPASDHREVAVGVDLTEGSSALAYAFETAAVRGARLRVVHAWQVPDRLLEHGGRLELKQLEEQLRWKVIEAHAPYRKLFPEVEVVEELPQDHPVAALEQISREVDLVVVGAHDRKALPSLRLGSTSHGIVHHAHCPVAITRQTTTS
ncbi:universal stress protein [Spirillospora sp. NPDC048911]|uniref:universal stress protein n=1 Tax=Spirillospora sp. NPDC048911 TaxID=3364527 RepID=UPI00371FEA33